jgi:putative flippase GtrA
VRREFSLQRILAFLATGLVATAISYAIFIPLEPRLGWLPAAGAAWAPSVIVAFLLNRRLTFGIRGRARIERQFGLYAVGAFSQLGLSFAGYFVLIEVLGLAAAPAFFTNLILTTAFSYAFMSLVTFARRAQPAA